MSAESNKVVVREAFNALNRRDRSAFAAAHKGDVVLHDHGERSVGIESVLDHEWPIFDAFPDFTYTLEDMVAEDDKVASRWTATGAHEGSFQGLEPTGVRVEIGAIGVFRLDDGKIAEVSIIADRFGLMQQLGLVGDVGG